MKPCGPCGCTDRQAAYTVAFVSIFHYCFHLVGISFALAGEFTTVLTQSQLYGLLVTTIILVFLSILLFFGVRYDSKCMILPWLIMVIFADIGYCFTMAWTFLFLVASDGHHDKNLVAFLVALLNFCVVTYLLWIIIRFFVDLFSWNGRRSGGAYEGLDEDDGDLYLKSSSRGRGAAKKQKSNIVSKLFPDAD